MFEREDNEESRYGRDKSLSIDHKFIDGGLFRRKFDKLSNNKELNRNIYQCSKTILNHRSGTDFEDMYWFDGDNGNLFASITDMTEPSKVVYQTDYLEKFRNITNKVTLHNHPRSMPPSIGDFESAYNNGYSKGIIICHNGIVFSYKSIEKPDKDIYETLTAGFRGLGYSEFSSELMALKEMKKRKLLFFTEVN
jgi:hypothetical protein